MGSGRPVQPVALGGVIVAAVTPYRRQGPEADLGATLDLIDYLCDAGAQGIALLGSTGEFLHLTVENRAHLIRFAVKRSRVPVLAGVSDSTLDGAAAMAEEAAAAGAAGLLLMPPYFFRYEQPEIREFYLRFAERLDGAAPLFLYNIPFFTSEIACDTACELLSTGAFAGVKDSSGQLDYCARLLDQRARTRFTVIVGNDVVFTPARQAGADGVVSGVACAVPELMLGLDGAIRHGLAEKTARLEARLQEFIVWLNRFPAPVGLKEATAARGLNIGPLAVPLSPDKQKELDEFRAWFLDWLPRVQNESRG
ncbi:MAG: dihydrodipicolinate synthase family protein [Bryobacteraceae bacterium]